MSMLRYWVWLASKRISRRERLSDLLQVFETPERIFFADRREYAGIASLTEKDRELLADKRMDEASAAIDCCARNNWRILTVQDVSYPERLRNIYAPPIVLFARGKLADLDSEAVVSVVGTRKCTPYGIRTAEGLGYELARSGCIVATGMARGIDSAAVKGALRGGGQVVGVAATGLDVIYPPENAGLYSDVAEEGVILTEYLPGTGVSRYAFPDRNRIMSGVSLGVCVVEAPEKSGALITADWALEQGRDVFAVPGNIDAPACRGSNKLLREGARIVLSGWDIAEEYRPLFPEKIRFESDIVSYAQDENMLERLVENTLQPKEKNEAVPIDNANLMEYSGVVISKEELSEAELAVLSVMDAPELQIDVLISRSGLTAAEVLSALTVLEIRGAVRQAPGKRFTRLAEVK